MAAYFVGFFLIGQPVALYSTFELGMGLKGIWMGVFVGNLVIVLYFGYVLTTMDWRAQIHMVKTAMEKDRAELLSRSNMASQVSQISSSASNEEEMKSISKGKGDKV